MVEHRQVDRTGWQDARTWWRQFWRETLFPFGLLDEKGNPSLVKMASVVLVICGTHGRFVDDSPVTGWDNTMAIAGLFGTLGKVGMEMYSTFKTNKENNGADLARRAIDGPSPAGGKPE